MFTVTQLFKLKTSWKSTTKAAVYAAIESQPSS